MLILKDKKSNPKHKSSCVWSLTPASEEKERKGKQLELGFTQKLPTNSSQLVTNRSD